MTAREEDGSRRSKGHSHKVGCTVVTVIILIYFIAANLFTYLVKWLFWREYVVHSDRPWEQFTFTSLVVVSLIGS